MFAAARSSFKSRYNCLLQINKRWTGSTPVRKNVRFTTPHETAAQTKRPSNVSALFALTDGLYRGTARCLTVHSETLTAPKATNYHDARYLEDEMDDKAATTCDDIRRETDRLIEIFNRSSEQQQHVDDDKKLYLECRKLLESRIFHGKRSQRKNANNGVANSEDGVEAAQQKRRLLDALCENWKRRGATGVQIAPVTYFYNLVINAYAMSNGGRQAAENAEALLLQMLTDCEEYCSKNHKKPHDTPPPEPNVVTFTSTIQAWAESGAKDAGDKAEAIFKKINDWGHFCDLQLKEQQHTDGYFPYQGYKPNEVTVVMMIKALSLSEGGLDKAFSMVSTLAKLAKDRRLYGDRAASMGLNNLVFGTLTKALMESKQGIIAAKKAEGVLKMMIDLRIRPDQVNYRLLLRAWTNAANYDATGSAAEQADNIFRHMVDLYSEDERIRPDKLCLHYCIIAWSRCTTRPDAPDRAQILFEKQLALYEKTKDMDIKPQFRTISTLLKTWSDAAQHHEAVQRAKYAIDVMKSSYHPHIFHYNYLLHCYSRRGMGEEAFELFDWLLGQSREGNVHLRPDTTSYKSVVKALVTSKKSDAPERAHKVLNIMETEAKLHESVKLQKQVYDDVIKAWARYVALSAANRKVDSEVRATAARNAEELLNRMLDAYKQNGTMKPNSFTFARCISAWSRSDHFDGPDKATMLFENLIHLYEESKDNDLKPSVKELNKIVAAWTTGIAIKRADSMTQATNQMKKYENYVSFDTTLYNTLMAGHAIRGQSEDALAIFNFLKNESTRSGGRKANLKPTRRTYNAVLYALAKDNTTSTDPLKMAELAEEILEEMKLNALNDSDLKPTHQAYQSAILTLLKLPATDRRRVEKVNKMLKEMIEAAIEPSIGVLVSIMRALGGSSNMSPRDHNMTDEFEKAFSHAVRASTAGKDSLSSECLSCDNNIVDLCDTIFDALAALDPKHIFPGIIKEYIRAVKKNVHDSDVRCRILRKVLQYCAEFGGFSETIAQMVKNGTPDAVAKTLEPEWSRYIEKSQQPKAT